MQHLLHEQTGFYTVLLPKITMSGFPCLFGSRYVSLDLREMVPCYMPSGSDTPTAVCAHFSSSFDVHHNIRIFCKKLKSITSSITSIKWSYSSTSISHRFPSFSASRPVLRHRQSTSRGNSKDRILRAEKVTLSRQLRGPADFFFGGFAW